MSEDGAGMVVMFDVDNTLLDNDLVRTQLAQDLLVQLGKQQAARFWELYEEVREETQLVDFPETIHRFALDFPESGDKLESLINGFPFPRFVYPESLRVLRHVASYARPIVVSDGDEVFQRHKIRVTGIEDAVEGNVLIFVHKEQHLADIEQRFPAQHYVMVDDKPRIQAAVKSALGDRVTTVMVCQGKYANDPDQRSEPEPDITIGSIADLLVLTPDQLWPASGG